MESFALEAESKGAVVMLALHGGVQANGAVQRFLEEMDIPFTGPSWQSAYLCGNQVCPPLLPTRADTSHTDRAGTGRSLLPITEWPQAGGTLSSSSTAHALHLL